MTEAVKRKRAALGLSATVYTPDDMQANEAGYLSEAQIERLRRIVKARIKILAVSLVIALAATIVTSVLVPYTQIVKTLLIIVGFATIIGGGLTLLYQYLERREAITDGKVNSITGLVQRKTVVDTGKGPYIVEDPRLITVDKVLLKTDAMTWSAIRDNCTYIVYFTRIAGYVVLAKSLEPAIAPAAIDNLQFATAGTRESDQEYRIRLMQRFNITEAELEQNEQGVRAKGQTSKVWDRLFDSVLKSIQRLLALWIGIGIVIIWLMLVILRMTSSSGAEGTVREFSNAGLQLALVAFLGVVLWTIWKLIPTVLDIFTPDVVIMDGIVSPLKAERSSRSSYSFVINGLEFPVNQPAYEILNTGDPYTVYFTPHSRTLLAVEWLGASPFKPEGKSSS